MQPLDSTKFAPVLPALNELLKPLCPAGFHVVLLVVEPDPRGGAFTHMVSDVHDNAMIATLLHSISLRLHGPDGEPPGVVH